MPVMKCQYTDASTASPRWRSVRRLLWKSAVKTAN